MNQNSLKKHSGPDTQQIYQLDLDSIMALNERQLP